MSDEIDIEEHDVLDNPNIRRIFPDLSVIKKEISQYEEGLHTPDESVELNNENTPGDQASDASINSISQETKHQTSVDEQLEVHIRFKNFLNSLVDDVSEKDSDIDVTSQSDTEIDNDNVPSSSGSSIAHTAVKCLQDNVLILGSKPNIKCEKTEGNKQLKIMLKNLGPYLNGSKQYCKQCFILFPNTDALKYHKSSWHSLKNHRPKKKIDLVTNTKFKCHICTINLSSKGSLVRHIKSVHKIDDDSDKTNMVETRRSLKENGRSCNVRPPLVENKNTVEEPSNRHSCFHCTQVFKDQSSLIEHIYDILNPNRLSPINPKTEQIPQTPERVKYGTKLTKSDDKKCSQCTLICKNQDELEEHKSINHNEKILRDNKLDSNPEDTLLQMRPVTKRYKSSLAKTAKGNKSIKKVDENCVIRSETNSDINSEHENDMGDFQRPMQIKSTYIRKQKGSVFQCFVCSQYYLYSKPYTRHMLQHNIKEVSDIDKVQFDSQCPFCSLNIASLKQYNQHISKTHQDKLKTKINFDDEVFKSLVFKCVQCDVFFLCGSAAVNHSEHNKIFVNWECVECRRTFKMKDKLLHMKQHSLSKHVIAYVLCESAWKRVLYKCLKCAVHFNEKDYFLHYPTCGTEIASSTYCKKCDTLINNDDMECHNLLHQNKLLQSFDFISIETDIITNKANGTKGKIVNPHLISKLALTFCRKCDCFLGEIALKRKAHVEGRCSHIIPKTCHKCGLKFTNRGYVTHAILHKRVKGLTLQSYYFYDMTTKKQILPPIPKYPSCDVCGVHFHGKRVIKQHECDNQNYIKCNICHLKLTETAYKLHMNYHKYKLSSSALTKAQISLMKRRQVKSDVALSRSNSAKSLSPENLISNSKIVNEKVTTFSFDCIICHITVNTYDEVVLHCQDHYDFKKSVLNNNYKTTTADNKCTGNIIALQFDPFYFRFKNSDWKQHIFKNITIENIQNVLGQSIYQLESRLKLEELQSGPPNLSLYKCDVCRSYIDPEMLYLHAETFCIVTKKYPCSICGLCFSSPSYKLCHEKVHEQSSISITSYRIIIFNKSEHHQFNKMMFISLKNYFLYQCRNCEGIIDKFQRESHSCNNEDLVKCSHCGLLFYDHDYNTHVSKHKEIDSFKSEQITVIIFGTSRSQNKNKMKPSFVGSVYDITFYKCTNCDLCLRSSNDISDHVCPPKYLKSECPNCNLHFLKKELQTHLKLHENNLGLAFDNFILNIIPFNLPTEKIAVKSKDNCKSDNNANKGTNAIQTIYKCSCGLHFLEKMSASKHCNHCNPRLKISRQSCFKCDLLFTPGELFNHLLKHHSDKKIKYMYDIVNVSKEDSEESKSLLFFV